MNKFSNRNYDLEERTTKFAENIINLCKKIPNTVITNSLINQLVRAGTSIGANYSEANGASSKKDFKNKIYVCKKESKETKYWLRILAGATPELAEECRILWKEAQEFTLIFSKVARTVKESEAMKIGH